LQSDITLQSPDEQAVNEPSPQQYMRAPRRRRHEIEPITLDTAFIRNLPKVNFALLLALLMREKGRVQLTQRELDAADDERLNVMFALSLDGKALEVSLVSTQSGIIRSPEANLWAQPGENLQQLQPGAIQSQTILSPPPYSSPPLPPVADESARREQAAAIVRDWQQQHPDGSGPEAGRIVEMPNPQQPQQARKAPEMVFPFQVGANPQDAKSVSLSEIQTDLQRDRQIQQQEQIAAARVEGGSA
jgi:hypothetical protein